jgi:hypothetical protein
MIFGAKESGKISKIRDNSLFIGNHPEPTKNKPIEARPGTLSSDSPKNRDNPLYRSFLAFKRRHKNLDFVPPFLGILADNPRKTANISQIQTVTATPNGYG